MGNSHGCSLSWMRNSRASSSDSLVELRLAWASGAQIVALDSLGAPERARQLQFIRPKLWIEEELRLQTHLRQGSQILMWVTGYSGVPSREWAADHMVEGNRACRG